MQLICPRWGGCFFKCELDTFNLVNVCMSLHNIPHNMYITICILLIFTLQYVYFMTISILQYVYIMYTTICDTRRNCIESKSSEFLKH